MTDLTILNDSLSTKLMLIVGRDGRAFGTFVQATKPQIVLSDRTHR